MHEKRTVANSRPIAAQQQCRNNQTIQLETMRYIVPHSVIPYNYQYLNLLIN